MSRHLYRKPAVIIGKDVFREWTITPPANVSGADLETKYSGFVAIPDPKPAGSGLFAVPGIGLHGVGTGLSLEAEVEFHNETELLSSSPLGGLSLPHELVVAPTTVNFQGWAPSNVGPGDVDYTSAWSNLSVPIPYDDQAFWVVTWLVWLQTQTTYNIDLSVAIDFGDESGVLFSVDPIHHTIVVHPDWHPGEGSADTEVTVGVDEVTWTGNVTRVRYRISGTVEAGAVDIWASVSGSLNKIYAAS